MGLPLVLSKHSIGPHVCLSARTMLSLLLWLCAQAVALFPGLPIILQAVLTAQGLLCFLMGLRSVFFFKTSETLC